jgi:hypothetical protein
MTPRARLFPHFPPGAARAPDANVEIQAFPAVGKYKPSFPLEKGGKAFFSIFLSILKKPIEILAIFSVGARRAKREDRFLLEAGACLG